MPTLSGECLCGGIRYHVFVGSKAPWHEIRDDLPRYEELPPDPDLIHEVLD